MLASAFPIHTMKTSTAKVLIQDLPLNLSDMARIVLEITERLGTAAGGLNRAEMMRLLRRVTEEGVRAVQEAEQTVSFEEAARQSLEARQDRRPTTRRDLRHFIGRMLRVPEMAQRPLRSMHPADCRKMLQTAFGNSPSSFRKGRAILSSIFNYGIRQEWCDRNPVLAIETPRVIERTITPLTLEEVGRLEQAAERPEHQEMQFSLKLMLYCGIRPTEVTRIDPRRDIVGNELIIRPNTSKTGGGRVVPLRKVAGFVKKHREKLCIPPRWEQRWRALRRAARFHSWQPDICRHTFATYHASHFRNLAALQLEMGHTTPRLLLSRYLSPIQRGTARSFWGEERARERQLPLLM
ncbi:MAG: hypothetical protein MJ051_04875 [Akkermansia sp.]|nr:hypothetical protein [Akkermansia sp.]